MNVVKNEKGETLWHIQNRNICSDGSPYDMFIWLDHEPTELELANAFVEDYGIKNDWELEEWLSSSDVYQVVAYDAEVTYDR